MKKSNTKKVLIISAITLSIVIASGFFFLGVFSQKNTQNFYSLISKNLTVEIKDSAYELSEAITDTSEYVNLAVLMTGDKAWMMKDPEFLSDVVRKTSGYKAIYLDEKNIGYDEQGNKYNLAKADYIETIRRNNCVYSTRNGVDDKEVFVVSGSPVDSGRRVLVFIDKEVFTKIVGDDENYKYAFYAILDDRKDLLCTEGRTANVLLLKGNIWKSLEEYAVTTAQWNNFRQKYAEGKQSVLEVKQNKSHRYITYSKIEGTHWILLGGYDKNAVNVSLEQYSKPALYMRIQISICLIVLAFIYGHGIFVMRKNFKSNRKELIGKAETDLLTGAFNKAATEEHIREYIRNNPDGQGVFILIDVDNFKKINDTMGHAFGDEVLRNLGLRLQTLYRATDIIGRVGGDEFVVFLKDIKDMKVAQKEAKKLEVFFKGFEVGEYTKYSVNASLGASMFPMDGSTFDTLYKTADEALYGVKHTGKNRLAFYREDEKFTGEINLFKKA